MGGPNWTRTERFEIAARAGRDVDGAELRVMVRSLLRERFALVVRREQREMTAYALVRTRTDGLGPALEPNTNDCKGTVTRPAVAPTGGAISTGCGTIDRIALMASRMMATPVTDKTGLQGQYEYALVYAMDGPRSVGGVALPIDASSTPSNLPSFSTALREQLGLTLDAGRVAVDVIVIEAVERPTPN